MSVKKLTLASLIILSLTACSSGGSSSNVNNDKPQNNLAQTQSSELDSVKSELSKAQSDLENAEKAKVEAESQLSNLNSEKQAIENQLNSAKADLVTAQKRLQQAESDKTTTNEELETARANLAKAEQALANKTAIIKEIVNKSGDIIQERNQQQIEAENENKQQIEQLLITAKKELIQKETAVQLATTHLQQEQSRLSRLESENANMDEIVDARNSVWNAQNNKEMAENQLNDQKNRIIDLENGLSDSERRIKESGGYHWITFDRDKLPTGFSKHAFVSLSPESKDGIFVGNHYIYLTPDVTLVGRDTTAYWSAEKPEQRSFRVQNIQGTPTVELPQSGIATYSGKGFNSDNLGTLNYQVDFANKTGSGALTNFSNGIADIHLEQGKIEAGKIKADAAAAGVNGKYELGFYGENARSIAGEVYLPKSFEGGIKTNTPTAEKYGDTYETRGTVFGIAGEVQ